MDGPERRFEFPDGMSREDERAILNALERYFVLESPKPNAWVLQGRVDAIGVGALQSRRLARASWPGVRAAFVRYGVPPAHGRGDTR
ncbi:MAG: hypothetical protein ABJC60_01150 [Actinomycetota bacterium]